MQEVNGLFVNGGSKLWIGIELGFPASPVIALLPVLDQPFDGGEGHAVGHGDAGQFVGPANTGQPCFEIVYLRLRDSNGRWGNHKSFLLSLVQKRVMPPLSYKRS